MNQGPSWDYLMKRARGQKSHDTVSLKKLRVINRFDEGFLGFIETAGAAFRSH
jgi:hypothetical protein